MKQIASAPGNIFLFGEHAVLYGSSAIVASVDLRTDCIAEVIDKDAVEIYSEAIGYASKKGGVVSGKKELYVLIDLCDNFRYNHNVDGGIRLTVKSEIPIESGMSSSGAVLVSALCSLYKLRKTKLEPEKYEFFLRKYQEELHGGKASCAELLSSVYGGFHTYSGKSKEDVVNSETELEVVIGDTGIRSKTKDTTKYLKSFVEKNSYVSEMSFEEIDEIVQKGLEVIESGDLETLGVLLSQNHEILRELGLSCEKLDSAVETAIKAGALGAKLSGKGRGGIMFALVDEVNKNNVAEALQNLGLKTIETKLGCGGVY